MPKNEQSSIIDQGSQAMGIKKIASLVICAIGVLFLIFLLISHNSHKIKEQAQLTFNNTSETDQNQQLIDHLNAKKQATKQNVAKIVMPDSNVSTHQTPLPDYSHALLQSKLQARMSAPTSVYVNNEVDTSAGGGSVLSGHDGASQFANSQNSSASVVNAFQIKHPNYSIISGEMISAILESAVNSELPGLVRAVVSRNVYSYDGSHLLIAKGSRLIGQYSSSLGNGSASNRVFIMWNRVITPRGVSVMLNSPNTDQLGQSGQGANSVDHHFFKIFGTSALLSILSAGASNTGVSDLAQPNSADAYRQAIASSMAQSSSAALSQNMAIKPTIHIQNGASINVFVAHDLNFYSLLRRKHRAY